MKEPRTAGDITSELNRLPLPDRQAIVLGLLESMPVIGQSETIERWGQIDWTNLDLPANKEFRATYGIEKYHSVPPGSYPTGRPPTGSLDPKLSYTIEPATDGPKYTGPHIKIPIEWIWFIAGAAASNIVMYLATGGRL